MSEMGDLSVLQTYRHTTSHILAHAVKRLYPETHLAIGPAIDNGFYYDFDREQPFSNEELAQIEQEMGRIIKENLPLQRIELPRVEARQLMLDKGEPYKVELIDELPVDAVISFYQQGDFIDLCAGPHLERTGQVKAFKLTQTAGAYWRGSEKNKMLHRIYGTSFPDKQQLTDFLAAQEEARKRDHNKIGRELGFFTTTEYIGQGLPIMLPKGAKVIQILQRFVEDEEERRGYLLTKTPFMAKSDLYKISGHWQHYREGMFIIGNPEREGQEDVLALRPMTCPFQFQAYLTKTRSYRELPIRYNETSTLFRNEASGEMHGLIRVRQFTISEGHIACMPEQLEQEFRNCLDLAQFMLKAIGLDDQVSYRFSKWDPENKDKFIGAADQWDKAQGTMQGILDHIGLQYAVGIGEAAFYGPKLDIQVKNVFGKEDTLITIQVDFQLAERFGMEYVDADGQKRLPIIIHRTSIGCYERTLALLIEKYAGALPFWLAPEQIRILAIAERHLEAAAAWADTLRSQGFRVSVDSRDEKIGKKIREAQLDKVPYMLVLGDAEISQGTASVRSRKAGDLGALPADEIVRRFRAESEQRVT